MNEVEVNLKLDPALAYSILTDLVVVLKEMRQDYDDFARRLEPALEKGIAEYEKDVINEIK